MVRKLVTGLAVVAVLTWTASAQDARQAIQSASQAMGVDALKTVQYSATGYDFALGQAPNPSSPWPKFINKSYTRSIDFEKRASQLQRVRMQGENPPRGGGQQPIVGEQPQNQTIIVAADTPWPQQLELIMMPHGFLRAAGMKSATVEAKTVGGKKYNVVSFLGDNKAKVNGYINAQNLVERVETWIDNPFLGDMLFEAIYTDYKDIGGAQFPMHIVQKQGGYPIFDLTLADVKANAAVNIQAPQGRGGAPAGGGAAAAAPAAQSEKLGDGVYLITGGYAVIAVDFKDYIAFVECGNSEARALSVIAEAKRLFPNKPIKYLINTHAHFDHSGGLRTYVDEGATIVTHEMNKAYYEKAWSAPHTLNPDRLEQSKKTAMFETFSDKHVVTDGRRAIEIYPIQGSGHNDAFVMVYLPRERILAEADAFTPAAADAPPPTMPNPFSVNLYDNVQRLKLDVRQIAALHGPRITTMADLRAAIGQRTNTTN